ncbi:hypothetical protein HMPREF2787_04375 [Corynebacterium sp. HMSC061H03]|uniref:hypothetical protein n=1 Tax=Corynebacterium sp. HMSC061H03 TaxID=1739291 RepID=UPI0008A8EF44|nr:hypothetical protein [Corynebacterium sp. HMSC061H03]OHR23099.1 hypothetical protein HMPREF2787_04375 [Corynebacterium sp. HMSC061H03]
MQDNEPVRRQGPRRKAGSEGIPEEQERKPRNEQTTAPAVGADAAIRDAPRKKADGAGGVASADSKSSNSKVILGAVIGLPLVVVLAVAIAAGLNREDGNEAVAADDASMSTSSTPTVEPIDYDVAESAARLYCYDAPDTKYEEDWRDIQDTCVQLVLDEIRADEDTFRSEAVLGESGEIDDEAIEAVLGDPEDFLKNHGYTTTTSTTTTTKSSTYTPSPTYQEPEPTYEEPSNSGGNADAGVGGGGRQLAWRTVGPFGGLQGCEYSASQQPLYASECYVGSDNLYYYDSKVQAG